MDVAATAGATMSMEAPAMENATAATFKTRGKFLILNSSPEALHSTPAFSKSYSCPSSSTPSRPIRWHQEAVLALSSK
jgi:hypothetical protein